VCLYVALAMLPHPRWRERAKVATPNSCGWWPQVAPAARAPPWLCIVTAPLPEITLISTAQTLPEIPHR